jgi:hypothetical protein
MNTLEQEERLKIFIQSGWTCYVCKGYLNAYGTAQLGHKIPQTKYNLRKYGKEILHHRLNMEPVCCLDHNSKVAIGKSMEREISELVEKIKKAIAIKGKTRL